MSKRTSTDNAIKNPKDYWATPDKATAVLGRHLSPGTLFVEPCAGDGAIIRVLARFGVFCRAAYDVVPRAANITQGDAITLMTDKLIITNPPYRQSLLQPLLDHWIGTNECWLLLPLDMAANVWTNPYMQYVDHVLPLGRVSWMANGKAGFENSAWFHFAPEPKGLILPRN